MNKELEALERKLEIRNRELAEAHSHIAALEEKLLKLKQYRRELKSLKEERRTLRKSPERRIGQVLLAPYRVLEKPAKTVWRKLHQQKPTLGNSVAQSEYQQWFQHHRASAEELQRMRVEARSFRFATAHQHTDARVRYSSSVAPRGCGFCAYAGL